jgi:hypothetical protein
MALKMGSPRPAAAAMPTDPFAQGLAVDLLGPMLTDLLSCTSAALSPQVGRALVAPGGLVAWDECCDGMTWTRLISLDYTPDLAHLGANNNNPCGLKWNASIGVGVLRCSSTVNDQGQVAGPEVFIAEAMQMTQDSAALCQAIYCCNLVKLPDLQVQRWDALGPDGGCVGGEWTITMKVNNYGCSDT